MASVPKKMNELIENQQIAHVNQIIVYDHVYELHGIKYHLNFPIAWALDHKVFQLNDGRFHGTGPLNCETCRTHMTIHDGFIGYCWNCLPFYYHSALLNRGDNFCLKPGLYARQQGPITLLKTFPYMSGFTMDYSIGNNTNVDNLEIDTVTASTEVMTDEKDI